MKPDRNQATGKSKSPKPTSDKLLTGKENISAGKKVPSNSKVPNIKIKSPITSKNPNKSKDLKQLMDDQSKDNQKGERPTNTNKKMTNEQDKEIDKKYKRTVRETLEKLILEMVDKFITMEEGSSIVVLNIRC